MIRLKLNAVLMLAAVAAGMVGCAPNVPMQGARPSEAAAVTQANPVAFARPRVRAGGVDVKFDRD
ncbi:hypothetical protein PQQ84_32170 [Paraburkholderia strydomiana]|uniref:hypothetical protein n=1 Tax=Paraburkholderia strydomiana TaxID=1245417 RepID=UPI0038B9BB8A